VWVHRITMRVCKKGDIHTHTLFAELLNFRMRVIVCTSDEKSNSEVEVELEFDFQNRHEVGM
jgi:hypothetical protein